MGERVYEINATIFVEADSLQAAETRFWDAVDEIAHGGSSTCAEVPEEDWASSADTDEEG